MDLGLPKVERLDDNNDASHFDLQRIGFDSLDIKPVLGENSAVQLNGQEVTQNRKRKRGGRRRGKAQNKAKAALNNVNVPQNVTNPPTTDLINRLQQILNQANDKLRADEGKLQRIQASQHSLPQFDPQCYGELFGQQFYSQPQVVDSFLHVQSHPMPIERKTGPEVPYRSQGEAYAMGFRAGVRAALKDAKAYNAVEPTIVPPFPGLDYKCTTRDLNGDMEFIHPSRRTMVEFGT